ncbi:flagellar assembly protein FliW [Alkalihalobacterium bogoriense]|uniref:flagellar assembly protein FliW n=1 Tax=Alkalihalobacterium bogoriense TaxID=246272 RepID=UPI00047CBCEF|nr:flagellar assembly protein FliW [Alkalihalobacterium bogoriense]
MKINTKFLGEVEVDKQHIITFEKGLPAFEEEHEFIVLPFSEDSKFLTLQSLHTVDCAFVIADPFSFYSDYKVQLSESTIEQLELESEGDAAIFVLLTVHAPFNETTANLQGPIVINLKQNKGKQIVLSDSDYTTKHLLFPLLTTAKEEK